MHTTTSIDFLDLMLWKGISNPVFVCSTLSSKSTRIHHISLSTIVSFQSNTTGLISCASLRFTTATPYIVFYSFTMML